MSDRKSEILAAMLKVEEQDYTAAGVPSVDALNLILDINGHEETTAKERDEYWTVFSENQGDPEVAGEASDGDEIEGELVADVVENDGYSLVTVTSAQSDPVKLYVHGVGSFSLTVGEELRVPTEALDALSNSDVKFTVGGEA